MDGADECGEVAAAWGEKGPEEHPDGGRRGVVVIDEDGSGVEQRLGDGAQGAREAAGGEQVGLREMREDIGGNLLWERFEGRHGGVDDVWSWRCVVVVVMLRWDERKRGRFPCHGLIYARKEHPEN